MVSLLRVFTFLPLIASIWLIHFITFNPSIAFANCEAFKDIKHNNIHYIEDNNQYSKIFTYSINFKDLKKEDKINEIINQIMELQKSLLLPENPTEAQRTQGFLDPKDRVKDVDLAKWRGTDKNFRIYAACMEILNQKELQLVGYAIVISPKEFRELLSESETESRPPPKPPQNRKEWEKFLNNKKKVNYIRELGIHTNFRGKGIGRILVNECKKENQAGLVVDIHDDINNNQLNSTSNRLFEKTGFEEIQTIKAKPATAQRPTVKWGQLKIRFWPGQSVSDRYADINKLGIGFEKEINDVQTKFCNTPAPERQSGHLEKCVLNLTNAAFKASEERYNVIVFNLNQEYVAHLKGIQFFQTVTNHQMTPNSSNLRYGIWVFERGSFRNKGDDVIANWAFKGSFTREEKNPKYVEFSTDKVFHYEVGIKNKKSGGALGHLEESIEASDDDVNLTYRQWEVVPTHSDYFGLINKQSGKVLDLDEGKFLQASTDDVESQEVQWEAQPNDSGYFTLKNRKSKKALWHDTNESVQAVDHEYKEDSDCRQWQLLLIDKKPLTIPGMGGIYVCFAIKNRRIGLILKDHGLWEVKPTDSGYFALRNEKSKLYLNSKISLEHGGKECAEPSNESNIKLCHQWKAIPTDSGYFSLVNRSSQEPLEHPNEEGTRELQRWNNDPPTNQQWQFLLIKLQGINQPESLPLDKFYDKVVFIRNRFYDKVVFIRNRATEFLLVNDGDNHIPTASKDGKSPNCQWEVIPVDSKYFKFKNKGSGTFLEHYKGKSIQALKSEDKDIDTYCHWQDVHTDDSKYFALKNIGSGMTIDHYYEKSIEALNGDPSHPHHQWEFLPTDTSSVQITEKQGSSSCYLSAVFSIINKDSNKVLEYCDGTCIQAIHQFNNMNDRCQWQVVPFDSDYFGLKNRTSKMLVEHFNQKIIYAFVCDGDNKNGNHQWKLVPILDPNFSGYFALENRSTGMLLEHHDEKFIQAFNKDRKNLSRQWQFRLICFDKASEKRDHTWGKIRTFFAIRNEGTHKVLAQPYEMPSVKAAEEEISMWEHQWEIEPSGADNFILKNRKSKQLLRYDTEARSLAVEAIKEDGNNEPYYWKIVNTQPGVFVLKHHESNKTLKCVVNSESPLASDKNQEYSIQVSQESEDNGNTNQQWEFQLVELEKK